MTDANIGDLVARAFEIRKLRKNLKAEDDALKEEFDAIEQVLLAHCDEQGATGFRTPAGTVSVSEDIVPTVVDWDEFIRWVIDSESTHFLQRRVNSGAFREALKLGDEIPGLKPYLKRSVGFTAK